MEQGCSDAATRQGSQGLQWPPGAREAGSGFSLTASEGTSYPHLSSHFQPSDLMSKPPCGTL